MALSVYGLRASGPVLLEENITKVFFPLMLLANEIPHPTCHLNALFKVMGGKNKIFVTNTVS